MGELRGISREDRRSENDQCTTQPALRATRRCTLSVMRAKPSVFRNSGGSTHKKRQSLAQEELGQDRTDDLVGRIGNDQTRINIHTVHLHPLPRSIQRLTTLSAPRGVTKIAAVNAIPTEPTTHQPQPPPSSLLSATSNGNLFNTHQKRRNYKSLPRSSSSYLTTRSNSSNTHDLLQRGCLISW